MRTFAAVVDAGSFVGAADALAMSKPAVSRHVNELEARLGVRLLQRTTRRLSLTGDGEVFHARCKELLAQVDEAEAEVSSRSGEATGLLKLSVPVTFGERHLAPLWPVFMAQHPRVSLEVSLSDRAVDLVEEGFDLAVRIGLLQASSLVSRPLARSRLVLCASPAYLARHGTPQHPAELARHAVLTYTLLSTGDHWRFTGAEGEVVVNVNPRFRSNSGETCRSGALAGQGVILQPDFLVGPDIAAGTLVELMPQFRSLDIGIHAVYPTRKHVAPKVRRLIDFLVASFETPLWPV
ncbi:LysR family transcriptional regulator [Hydrogenophaga sp. MI9]|uniref:LysR family transcriptional regulator n=1 Tax=Hydrogenophaga sp. MI9 TaxID=3453719 RepID=UPI003EECD3B1